MSFCRLEKIRKVSSNIFAEIAQRMVKVKGFLKITSALNNFLIDNGDIQFLLNKTHESRQSVWYILK